MIDREARDRVAERFEKYLGDELTAFEFDERLQRIESKDRTVHEAIRAAWFHYDDCEDHLVMLSKPEWDYFQRLLLILRSDAEFAPEVSRKWSWDHAIAWAAFAGFVVVAFVMGWGWRLFAWAVPFGVVSMWIGLHRRRRYFRPGSRQAACWPFGSFSQIRSLRRQVPGFVKRAYRKEIGGRAVRSRGGKCLGWMLLHLYWIVFGPVVLLFQGFPTRFRQCLIACGRMKKEEA